MKLPGLKIVAGVIAILFQLTLDAQTMHANENQNTATIFPKGDQAPSEYFTGAAWVNIVKSAMNLQDTTSAGIGNNSDNKPNLIGGKMKIKIANSTFIATLYNNAAASAFKSLLPMTVNMIELNANEKYVDLSGNLPTNASNPGTIQAGDLMLYGSSTLVLFYKTFSTSYNYTRLGKIDDVAGLASRSWFRKCGCDF